MRQQPVVLVHGFASSFAREWVQPGWVDLLKDANREVIGIDLLGHGDAPKPHDPAGYADLTERVAAALPADGDVDGIGFSLGARVLLTLAAAQPQRFGRLVVAGVGANLFRTDTSDEVAQAIEEGDHEGEENIARTFARFAATPGNDPAALAACLRRPSRPMTADELGRIVCPVLVVLSDRDFAGPADPLVDALPDARFVGLSGVDHFGTPNNFKFIDAALEFLDAVPGG